jgi:hypothetical protein
MQLINRVRQRHNNLFFELFAGWTVQPGRIIVFIGVNKPNPKLSAEKSVSTEQKKPFT